MKLPVEIAYRLSAAKSEELEALIRTRAGRMEKFHSQIVSCRIAVEPPQGENPDGSRVRVRVEAGVPPGHRMVSAAEASEGTVPQSAQSATRKAFRAIERQLKRLSERQSNP